MNIIISFHSPSAEKTHLFGRRLGQCLPDRVIITFTGPLGAGKTTLIQGIVAAKSSDPVTSPTFVYHQRYQTGGRPIDHVDLYRLQSTPASLGQTGILDLLEDVPGWLLIEWPPITLKYPAEIPIIRIEASGQPEFMFQIQTEDPILAARIKKLLRSLKKSKQTLSCHCEAVGRGNLASRIIERRLLRYARNDCQKMFFNDHAIMTLLIQINGRTVIIGLAKDRTVLASLDATWQVGGGQSFPTLIQKLLTNQSTQLTAIHRVIISSNRASFTTIRTVLAFVNALAWSQPVELYEAPDSLASASIEQLITKPAQLKMLKGNTFFPRYQ